MKKFLLLLLLASASFMTKCRYESQKSLLSKVDSFLPLQPDSADVYLQSAKIQQLKGDEENALYALLRTMTDVLQDKEISSDTLIGMAYNYYSQQYQKTYHLTKKQSSIMPNQLSIWEIGIHLKTVLS